MIDTTTAQGARAIERLGSELIVWLTTVTPEGQPQSSPVWFLWEEDEIVLCSLATTPRVRNMRANPRVAVNLNSDAGGGDIVTFEGEARIEGTELPPGTAAAYRAKYQAEIDGFGWTWESFRRDYPAVVRIRPTRVRMG
jgi:PPOX class probable F420-dependent enzyme